MLKGFRDFIVRGNLVELAVAFVIGVAFASVVTSFVDNLLMPLIGKAGGRPDFSDITAGGIPVGQFITDLVAFLITAAAVYFLVVLPYTKAMAQFRAPSAATASDEVLLLREIRDLLAREGSPGGTP
jgi:large conductance mechanosensitive channel